HPLPPPNGHGPNPPFARPAAESPTELLPAVTSSAAPPPELPDQGSAPSSRRRPVLVAAAVLGLLALLYTVDVVLSLGAVPRGVTVAGVPVGGLSDVAAESELRSEIEPRTTRPVAVTVGQVQSELDPRAAGLAIDWSATLDRAGSQPLNPFTRIASLFGEREVGVVTVTDTPALLGALEQLAPVVDRAPVEGTVAFEGTTPTPVDPVPGQRLEVASAANVLREQWANGTVVALPLTELPPITTPADVATAIDRIAEPAMSGPVTVLGEQGARATITPEDTAAALSFRAEPGQGLVPELNPVTIEEALRPQLASTETPGRDATLNFSSGAPVVVPSQDGRGIDYEVTLADLLRVLTGTGAREITAVYAEQPAELTTEELNGLGITGLISEFQTGGFARDSGLNIKRAAEQINGLIVEPGATFSLNAATVPRNAANGYVEAGIIDDGAPSRGIGGGVSQVATTLYNAAYFAGMVDVAHKEHSFYIGRYPAGREATVFEGSIDLKFRNDNPTGVLIQTAWTPTSLTVRMYGTKRYEVTSTPGPRTNPTQPQTVTIPAGKPCSPSQGAPGFTITDTRTLREISTGQTRNETRTVRYNPSPIVVCAE
ncbi:MAG: VanW family protein, partial [Pseudonocardia sp.]